MWNLGEEEVDFTKASVSRALKPLGKVLDKIRGWSPSDRLKIADTRHIWGWDVVLIGMYDLEDPDPLLSRCFVATAASLAEFLQFLGPDVRWIRTRCRRSGAGASMTQL